MLIIYPSKEFKLFLHITMFFSKIGLPKKVYKKKQNFKEAHILYRTIHERSLKMIIK